MTLCLLPANVPLHTRLGPLYLGRCVPAIANLNRGYGLCVCIMGPYVVHVLVSFQVNSARLF
jgi:hypothetical protein